VIASVLLLDSRLKLLDYTHHPSTKGTQMGLVISHGTFQGSHSSFNTWRHEVIGPLAGYDIETMDTSHITDQNIMGEWLTPQKDPIIYLLCHQDFEGFIDAPEGLALAKRLRELLPRVPREHKMTTRKFIKGLELAASLRDKVIFS
jgi:hypothetical protein